MLYVFFFFNDTATTEIYTLSLHDALPIYVLESAPLQLVPVANPGIDERLSGAVAAVAGGGFARFQRVVYTGIHLNEDRKSTRLNSSHANISYAVFCLKKKKKI